MKVLVTVYEVTAPFPNTPWNPQTLMNEQKTSLTQGLHPQTPTVLLNFLMRGSTTKPQGYCHGLILHTAFVENYFLHC